MKYYVMLFRNPKCGITRDNREEAQQTYDAFSNITVQIDGDAFSVYRPVMIPLTPNAFIIHRLNKTFK